MADLREALRLLKAGQWQEAHLIAQRDESPAGCWVHAVVHLLEGDQGNADYWFRRAGRPRARCAEADAEIARLEAELGG